VPSYKEIDEKYVSVSSEDISSEEKYNTNILTYRDSLTDKSGTTVPKVYLFKPTDNNREIMNNIAAYIASHGNGNSDNNIDYVSTEIMLNASKAKYNKMNNKGGTRRKTKNAKKSRRKSRKQRKSNKNRRTNRSRK